MQLEETNVMLEEIRKELKKLTNAVSDVAYVIDNKEMI